MGILPLNGGPLVGALPGLPLLAPGRAVVVAVGAERRGAVLLQVGLPQVTLAVLVPAGVEAPVGSHGHVHLLGHVNLIPHHSPFIPHPEIKVNRYLINGLSAIHGGATGSRTQSTHKVVQISNLLHSRPALAPDSNTR